VTRSVRGFTLVEVLIAVIVLSVGITALVGSSALVTRMVGRGGTETRAAEVAQHRLDTLRLVAYSTTTQCTSASFANGGPVTVKGMRERWIVSGTTIRQVTDTVTHRTARGTHTDVLTTFIKCP
jgi:prepilin-type N-terminal cleavage/methylation domain-containing protein